MLRPSFPQRVVSGGSLVGKLIEVPERCDTCFHTKAKMSIIAWSIGVHGCYHEMQRQL